MLTARLRVAALLVAMAALLVSGTVVVERSVSERPNPFGGDAHARSMDFRESRETAAVVSDPPQLRFTAFADGRRTPFAQLLAVWAIAAAAAALTCRRHRLFTLVDVQAAKSLSSFCTAAGPRAPPALLA